MSDTNIGWTDKVWNPTTGCSKVSEGCRNCYAETISLRYGRSKHPWSAQFAAENVVLHPDRLDAPLKWKTPSRCFVNSMSDLFHEMVPDAFIYDVFSVMTRAHEHTFQVLTKRPERMAAWVTRFYREQNPHLEPLSNVWLGTSVEDQRAANERIPHLLNTPAAVRFLSCEPLLGPVKVFGNHVDGFGEAWISEGYRTWTEYGYEYDVDNQPGVDWVIVGGESGPGHRQMDLRWLLDLVEDCQLVDIPLFVKQDSGQYPGKQGRIPDDIWNLKQFPAATPPAPAAAPTTTMPSMGEG